MRLIVARCAVRYTGRLNATLPESTRLLIIKSDGSVLVHADAGGYKPLNWMTPPTVIEENGKTIVVRKRAGKTEDRLEIELFARRPRPGWTVWGDELPVYPAAAATSTDGTSPHRSSSR